MYREEDRMEEARRTRLVSRVPGSRDQPEVVSRPRCHRLPNTDAVFLASQVCARPAVAYPRSTRSSPAYGHLFITIDNREHAF